MSWPVNARTSAMLDEAQALYGATITAVKGSPVAPGGGSAYTHSGEGVIDVVGDDLPAMNAAMRQVGFASFERGIEGDGFDPHLHAAAINEPDLHEEAQAQVDSYLAGFNGLRNNLPDSGPRDWVGITWETYSGGTYVPPSGGDPVAIAGQFPGDRSGSFGDFPAAILTGTPAFTGGDHFRLNQIDTLPAPVNLHMDAGDSCILAISEDWAYYQQEEALAAGYYIIRATGGGSLDIDDAWDAYNYPTVSPTWVPQSSLGTAGDFAYFTASADLLDVSHLWNDGWPIIRLTCTSGSLDITWAGMQIQPASGFYIADAGFQWSANVAPSTTEPAMNGTGTYANYVDGSDNKWTVDDTLVRQIGAYDAWNGSGSSTVDAQGARDASLADFGPWTFLNQTGAGADLLHDPGGGLFGDPESWTATLAEKVSTFSAPTRAVRPSEPPGFLAILEYLRQGPSDFEWLDDDCGLIGWHIHDGNVGFTGDTDTFTLYLTEVDSGFDPSAEWFDGDGTVVLEQTVGDVDPIPAVPALTAIPDTFYTSSAQLIARRLTLAREQTDQLSFWTVENGYPAGNSGTNVAVDENNVVRARFRIPGWRFKQPTFVSAPIPPPVIDFDEDPLITVTWLRQRQRDDGLGNSVTRARGGSSRQTSLRQRGYR